MRRTIISSFAVAVIVCVLSPVATRHVLAGSAMNTVPVARAGSSRYAGPDPVVLDGTGSYDPDGYGSLSYQWTQISGPTVSITDANTATPTIGGFFQTSSIQECEFQLVVSDGDASSTPDMVKMIIVPIFGNVGVVLENPPFDPNKPTFIFFGGGNGGSGLYVGPPWEERANMISFSTQHNGRLWPEHANAIIVYLSSKAPNYRQRIQTSGFSKGARLPIVVGAYINTTYADSRYNVNHATVFDGPNPVLPEIPDFLNSSVGGEQSWVDNYRAGPNSAWPGKMIDGALTVYFPLGDHGTPPTWYLYSIEPDNVGWIGDVYNNGVTAGAYYSVIGPGKNLELAPHASSIRYYYEWDTPLFDPGDLEFYDELLYPGRLPELPTLVGPADGDTVDANGTLLTCHPCQNVVGYQLLMGSDPYDMQYVISDTPVPPRSVITSFPHKTIYWTIKARDQYGSTIFPDPRRLNVGDSVSRLVENVTKGRTYILIQDAIDDASDGDEIVVGAKGFDYVEDVRFNGRNVTLRSSLSDEEAAVIRGTGTGPAVTFSGGEDANCVLSGLTIMGGDIGVHCYDASPIIADCTIAGNADAGVDLFKMSKPNFVGCRVSNNGGPGVRLNVYGGRTPHYNEPILTNCIIESNQGRGIHGKKPTVRNCTITGNTLPGIDGDMPTVSNSVIYGNNGGNGQITGLLGTVTYSNVQGGFAGEGNVDAAPCFVAPDDGDYHIRSLFGRWDPNTSSWAYDDVNSPCIDAGDPNSDWTGELWPHGKRINMGAYGGTPEASMSASDDVGNAANLDNDPNGAISYNDLPLLLEDWCLKDSPLVGDLNRDAIVDFRDFAIFAEALLLP